jgi:hypothetical protein
VFIGGVVHSGFEGFLACPRVPEFFSAIRPLDRVRPRVYAVTGVGSFPLELGLNQLYVVTGLYHTLFFPRKCILSARPMSSSRNPHTASLEVSREHLAKNLGRTENDVE